ncbi:MAG: DUF3089 domain-containing protein [Deltaproteobacteria bacterium]|nr:DUF3089 domain-containing protein [Deltaproteobacteria bacterium]
MAELLVVAVLPGGRMTVAGLAESAPDIPVCQTPTQTRCVVAWNARGPKFVENDLSLHREDTRPLVCVNPITWRADLERADADQNPGGLFLESPYHKPMPGLASAQCLADGVLVVDELGEVPRDGMSRLLDRVLGPENYHAFEVQLYFMGLRENTNGRVEASVPDHHITPCCPSPQSAPPLHRHSFEPQMEGALPAPTLSPSTGPAHPQTLTVGRRSAQHPHPESWALIRAHRTLGRVQARIAPPPCTAAAPGRLKARSSTTPAGSSAAPHRPGTATRPRRGHRGGQT